MRNIRKFFAPPVFEGDEEKNRIASLTNTILLTVMFAVILTSIFVIAILRNYLVMGGIAVSMLFAVVIALFLLRRGNVRIAALFTVTLLWFILVAVGLLSGGVVSVSYATMIILIIIAALLLGRRAGIIVAIWNFVAVTLTWINDEVGIWSLPIIPTLPVSYWMIHTSNYAIVSFLLYLAMGNLTSALQRARRLAMEAEAQRSQLEHTVQERTQDLERDASYLRATTIVAHESVGMSGDLHHLLDRVTRVIGEEFGFYHVGIYLLTVDDRGNAWAVMRATSSDAGQRLMARGHRLRVGSEGMVGDVAQRGVYRLAEDVRQDITYRWSVELPDTRAELVLPLQVRSETIGVLDIQSTEIQAFNALDIQTLQALADQVAVAISNARLFGQAQQAVEAEKRAAGTLTAESWRRMLQTGQVLGFYSNEEVTAPAGNLWRPEMKTALRTGNPAQDEQTVGRLAVPVKVRGEVIGVIDFSKPAGGSDWMPEETALVESLTEQLGVALESARLYQDTQRRAVQERLVGEVTGHIRETLDMETMLNTAAEKMCQALGLEDLIIRLVRPESARISVDGISPDRGEHDDIGGGIW